MTTIEKSAIHDSPISKKVLLLCKEHLQEKVIDLGVFKQATICADNFEKVIVTEAGLADLDPLHAVYVYAQNLLSVLVEQISELPPLEKLRNAYVAAEEEYMPGGPPMSPLTKSYFTCWALFDLSIGADRESFGTVATDLCRYLNMDSGLIRVFEVMQGSRMGFYVHEGISGNCVLLRELITNTRIRAVVPSGYSGQAGEMWFARVMPEPFKNMRFGYSVVFTTPYVIGEVKNKHTYAWAEEKDWLAFFKRNLWRTGFRDRAQAYKFFMKYGPEKTDSKNHPERTYWNEYVFLAYVNYQQDMILLTGFPDRPSSLPQSPEGQKRLGY